MSKRETDAVAKILCDPENQTRSAEEVAELVIEALADAVKTLRAEEVARVADRVIEAVEGDRVEGIPARIIEAIDDRRARTHRLAVVGQIWFDEAQERPHTVILGPFSARGLLDSEEKFLNAVQGGTAARDAGQHLAWDTKTGRGRGRFMLAPIFKSPRDAWDFYRAAPAEPADKVTEVVQHLRIRHDGPTCTCGLRGSTGCHRHPAA